MAVEAENKYCGLIFSIFAKKNQSWDKNKITTQVRFMQMLCAIFTRVNKTFPSKTNAPVMISS